MIVETECAMVDIRAENNLNNLKKAVRALAVIIIVMVEKLDYHN